MAFFYDRKEDIWQADCGERVTLVESKEDQIEGENDWIKMLLDQRIFGIMQTDFEKKNTECLTGIYICVQIYMHVSVYM